MAEAWRLTEVPLIDEQKLNAVKELAEPGDADGFFRDLVELFFNRVPLLVSEMQAAYVEHDSEKMARSAHTLKGTSGNLGAARVTYCAEVIEKLGRKGEVSPAEPWLKAVEQHFSEVKSQLEKHLMPGDSARDFS